MPTHPFQRTILDRSGRGPSILVPVSVLGTSLSEIALVYGSANHLCDPLHNLGRWASTSWQTALAPPAPEPPIEHPPEPPEEPRREAQASEHCHQADMAGLELAGHRLGGAQRHEEGLLDGPAPAAEVRCKPETRKGKATRLTMPA